MDIFLRIIQFDFFHQRALIFLIYIGLGFGNSTQDIDEDTSIDESIFDMNVGIHFARFEYAVSDKWVLSANFGKFGYDYRKVEDNKNNSFALTLFEDSYVGIAYRF